MEAFQTPTRRLPARRARASNFTELAFDREDDEDRDGFQDSDHGGSGSAKEGSEVASPFDDEV